MKAEVHPLRVLLKALFLFAAINLLFALVNPPVGKLTLYNSIIPGRLRFPYEEKPAFYFTGYNAPIYEDFDAMFGTHVISKEKPAKEFRLVLLGDSATWGFGLGPDDTLSEQINGLNIQTCDGRNVRAYNLGYPFSYPTRDLLILDHAMDHQPDLVFWLITLSTLEPKAGETLFIRPHAHRYLELAESYDLKLTHFSEPIDESSFWDRTLVGQRKRLKNIALMQAFGVLWGATRIDDHISLQPAPGIPSSEVSQDLNYEERSPDEISSIFDSLMLDLLSAAARVTGDVPMILVNEPIFVAKGADHLVRYNGFYPRWVYDEYRRFMQAWTAEQDMIWLDYWNAIPPEDFTDQYFHRRTSGEKRFAKLLAPEIQKFGCP
ncbi:MAG TPA: hypothetical protein VK897_09360 [Anaerolineales bacterium]|nr:hypothetical protein [Anaerolineales bacterium]